MARSLLFRAVRQGFPGMQPGPTDPSTGQIGRRKERASGLGASALVLRPGAWPHLRWLLFQQTWISRVGVQGQHVCHTMARLYSPGTWRLTAVSHNGCLNFRVTNL